ncbi:hypothetical protein ARMGADRAFT_772075 [Armillaria gallica]|uniref:Uncharacterized protein n=1 Tax=Armillaria gallica TaxID=47427 RepID=A0A2H3CFN6_ARMGA|nr:hypothetical protein ARMGADRAFT_772075 [Armillaria gallica]
MRRCCLYRPRANIADPVQLRATSWLRKLALVVLVATSPLFASLVCHCQRSPSFTVRLAWSVASASRKRRPLPRSADTASNVPYFDF